MQELGFEALFTIAIPGALTSASAYMILTRFFAGSHLVRLVVEWAHNEWTFAVGMLIVSVVIGGLLATLMGFVEEVVMDPITRRSLRIERGRYEQEWDAYIDALEERSNPYIARLVMFMFFETRLGLAILSLLLAWSALHHHVWGWVACGPLAGMSFLLLHSGWRVHRELARYRHRRFGHRADE